MASTGVWGFIQNSGVFEGAPSFGAFVAVSAVLLALGIKTGKGKLKWKILSPLNDLFLAEVGKRG